MTSAIDHDAIFKELLSVFFLDFIELFVPQVLEYAELSDFSLEPTETVREVFSPFSKGKKKVADVVARVSFQESATCFLIHVESQSSAYSKEDFKLRMFHYFSRLHEKFRVPIYPIALFTFDEPEKEQENSYTVSFPDREVLKFSFVSIQLNRLNWRDFIERDNPVASALMAKMKIAPEERPQVKKECLRLLATFELDREKIELISGFIGTYLPLNEEEEEEFQQLLETVKPEEKERVMQFVTDWQEKGREEGLKQGRVEGLQQGKQQDILQLLEIRFEDVAQELQLLIKKLDDIELLGKLFVQAVTIQSLDDFESVVSQYVTEEEEGNITDDDSAEEEEK